MTPPLPRGVGVALAFALAIAHAGSAQAQASYDIPSPNGFQEAARSGGEYEMGFWIGSSGDSTLASVNGILRVGLVLDQVIDVRLIAGWAYGDLDQTTLGVPGGAGAAANPEISVLGILGEDRWRLRLGSGVTIPAVPGTLPARHAAFLASETRGMSELWLWSADRISIVPMLELYTVPADGLYVDVIARGAVMFPLDDDTGVVPLPDEEGEGSANPRVGIDAVIEASASLGWRHEHFLGGATVRGVYTPTFLATQIQTSASLFARVTGRLDNSSVELFGEARLDTNLGPDLAFGFEPLGRWGLYFTFGASAGGATVPPGRYGVDNVVIHGAEEMDVQSITACLGTRARSQFSIDIGLRGTPACHEPPFDADHLLLELWHWPWSEWPLFDESVLERDVERIVRWYRARGFYEAQVTSTTVDPPEATQIDDPNHRCQQEEDEDCSVDVEFTVVEGEPVTVQRIALRGLEGFPNDIRQQLRDALPFQRGDRFDETLYENTKTRMVSALAEAGYARARVTGEVKINRGRREAFLIYEVRVTRVTIGGETVVPRSVVGEVCVIGHDELPARPLFDVAGLDPGEDLILSEIQDAQRALHGLGVFSGVEVSPREETPEEREARERREDADLEDDEGGRDQDSDVTEEQEVNRPGVESPETRVGAETRTCRPGRAELPPDREAVPIDIRVSPGRLERFGVGVGFQAGQVVTFGGAQTYAVNQDAAQWDIHVAASYEHRNLFDNLIRGRLEIRPRVIFEMPFLNFTPAQDPPLGLLTSANFLWPAFVEGRTNLVLNIRHDLGPMPFTNFFRSELDGQLGLTRFFEDGRVYLGAFVHGNWFLPTDRQPIDPRDQLPETGALWLEEAIRIDLRNNPQNPSDWGLYFEASSQQMAQPLASWDLIRWQAEVRGYVPLFLGIMLALRFEMGGMHVLGYGPSLDDNNIYQLTDLGPPALHLRGGGASSNRGFLPGLLGDAEQRYVTLARDDDAIARGTPLIQRPVRISGGTRLWEASIEIRIPITPSFGAVLFGDAGDVARPRINTDEEVTWRFDYPQMAFGIGIRYRTIIGPIRLDVAFRPEELQVLAGDGSLPPTCSNHRASGCNPRNFLDLGFARLPGAYHLTIGESF